MDKITVWIASILEGKSLDPKAASRRILIWIIVGLLAWLIYDDHLQTCKRDPTRPECSEELSPW
jgi:hypothetical protein